MQFLDLDLDITLDDATECRLIWYDDTQSFHLVKMDGEEIATYNQNSLVDMSYDMANWNLPENHSFFLLGFVTAKFGREAANTLV